MHVFSVDRMKRPLIMRNYYPLENLFLRGRDVPEVECSTIVHVAICLLCDVQAYRESNLSLCVSNTACANS